MFKKIGEEAGKQTNAGVEHNSSGGEGTGVISCNEAREFVETLHQHSAAKSRKQQILVGAAERCQNAKDETTGKNRVISGCHQVLFSIAFISNGKKSRLSEDSVFELKILLTS